MQIAQGHGAVNDGLKMLRHVVQHDPALVILVNRSCWGLVVSHVARIGESRFGLTRSLDFRGELGNSSGVFQGTEEIRLARLACLFLVAVLSGRSGLFSCRCVSALDAGPNS